MVDLAARTAITLADKARNGHDPGANKQFWVCEATGAYAEGNTRLDVYEQATLDIAATYTRWHHWSLFEGAGSGTTSGPFDFSLIRRYLDWVAARGIPFMIRVEIRSFNNPIHPAPEDLRDDYEIPLAGGYAAQVHFEDTRLRYENCLKAIYDEFGNHPYFAGVQAPGETAGQNDCPGGAYDASRTEQQWNALLKNCSDYAIKYGCYFGFGWNFMRHAQTPVQLVSAWNNVLADVRTDNVFLFTPDILTPGSDPHWPSLSSRVYPLFTPNFRDNGLVCDIQKYRRASSFQVASHQMAPNHPNLKGDPTADDGAADINGDGIIDQHEQFIWGRDNLELDFVFFHAVEWPNNGNGNDFTFSRRGGQHGDAFGSRYGDDEGVMHNGWDAPYNPKYRDGPA